MLSQTPLFAWHAAHGAKLVDFAGWSMPIQYSSIVAEHQATRRAVGIFDVSHMGRFRFTGPESEAFLDQIVTRRVAGMKPGQIRYALVTNDSGGILDDVLVYHLSEGAGDTYFEMVVNASNRQKIWDWLSAHRGAKDVELADTTLDTAMIAVQGPRAIAILTPLLSIDPSELRYYHGSQAEVCGHSGIVSRTGYTGEDGCELVVPASAAREVWEHVFEAAQPLGGMAAGLGCRDTLRLEAGMPLYGHELNEQIDPFQAGLGHAVDLAGRSFPGSHALVKLQGDLSRPRRVGLEVDGKRVPREAYAVLARGQNVGRVTSGTFSPTLDRPIAMAYVPAELASPGESLAIDIRGQHAPARVVALPFYRRTA